jgi:hypothetical protein
MNHLPIVEPFAAGLEKIAGAMDESGLGGHATRGHAAILRQMASSMRADAAQGKMPHVFDGLGPMYAGAAAAKPQLSATTLRACAQLGLDVAKDRIDIGELNEALAKMSIRERITVKTELAHAGLID